MSEMCCTRLAEIQDEKKSPSAHHRTTLLGYIFATKACIDNLKKLLNSNVSSTCPHNMVKFGPLTAEIDWRVWGTRGNFNGFRVFVTAPTSLRTTRRFSSPNCTRARISRFHQRCSTEGATNIPLGGHHVAHRPTF